METTIVKKKLAKVRVKTQDIKSSADEPLGEKTSAILPEDITVMYLGKMALTFMKSSVRFSNMLSGYKRDYPEISEETFENLNGINHEFDLKFASIKRKIEKDVAGHPLVEKFSQIKGVTGYQVAILMAIIKDISKFDTASKLAVYGGIACVNGMPVVKANLNKIKDYRFETQNKEFKGFNTMLSGRMFVIVESMLKQKGWFYHYYQRLRKRLTERCLNGGETFICTAEQAKESKGKMKKGRHYMVGKKNYSLESFTHNNARRRCARVFLHIFWFEWRELRGLPTRIPYPLEYLGHTDYIKFEEIIA